MSFGADSAPRPAEAALSGVVRELLLLAITLLLGALFVVGLVYLPRALIIQPFRPSGWGAYWGMVTEFLQGVPRGNFGRNDRGAPVNRILATAVIRSFQLLGVSFVAALLCFLAETLLATQVLKFAERSRAKPATPRSSRSS